ncbi:hypothetical protein ACFL20_06935 [Spirochaetota bacterium]
MNKRKRWTKKLCKEEASKYMIRSEFQKKSSGAYDAALRNKWLDDICKHMKWVKKPNGYWTKDLCKKEAKKYNSRSEFKQKAPSAYKASNREGWLDIVCKHMKYKTAKSGSWTKNKCFELAKKFSSRNDLRKSNPYVYGKLLENKWINSACKHMKKDTKDWGYWTKQKCRKEAKKYKNRTEFRKKSNTAYTKCRKNGWLDEFCSHIKNKSALPGEWTLQKCIEIAKKYKNSKEMRKHDRKAYMAAQRHGWLQEISKDFDILGNAYRRRLYAFEFGDKSVYVGLTGDPKKRKEQHLKDKKVIKAKIRAGVKYKFKLKSKWMDREIIGEEERLLGEKYEKQGWTLLNHKSAFGALGGPTYKWDKENCLKEALNYDTRSKFGKGSAGACDAARRNGWLDDICEHMVSPIKPMNYWTKARCKEAAKECKSRKEFETKFRTACGKSRKNGWMDEFCKHMLRKSKPAGYWTLEKVSKIAKKCESKKEFKEKHSDAYHAAVKHKWLEKIFGQGKKPAGYWSKKRCLSEAKKYQTRNEFLKKSSGAYGKAQKSKWLNSICKHMVNGYKNKQIK